MKNKVIAALVAGGLLVGAGFVTSIVSSPGVASAQETEDTEERGFFQRGFDFLGDVLSDLVGEGTIDQADADAVLSAVEEKADEIKAQKEAEREILQAALEDGEITEAEVAELPDDHAIFSEELDEAWSDGVLTQEELREVRHHGRRGAFKRGFHAGSILDDGGIDADEFAELSDDHPLKTDEVEALLEGDGLITVDELRELFGDRKPFSRWGTVDDADAEDTNA